MAVRSGAGTGVIVSLVVFVLSTIFLLVLAIVFYAGKTTEIEKRVAAEADLEKYARGTQRSSDAFRGFEQAATSARQSVAGYLNGRYEELMRYVNGDVSIDDIERLRADLARYGVQDDEAIRHAVERMNRDLRNGSVEIEGLKANLDARDAELAEKAAQITAMKESHAKELQDVGGEIAKYREAAEQHAEDVRLAIESYEKAVQDLEEQFDQQKRALEDELDGSNQQRVLLGERVDELEQILRRNQKQVSAEQLVDATIIDIDTTSDQVFIDRGRRDHVTLGMTFEVYDDAASVGIDSRTGEQSRGKASVQVVKVGETTSTCKITRALGGRPIVRNNIVANAVYDPNYRLKFLVHGKFDVDGDSKPSEAEAEFLRAKIVERGGEIVIGEELPGDLDFLVLGKVPEMPPPLRPDATPLETKVFVDKREARRIYDLLFTQASEAQIPVLNANRFFILIGHTDR